MKEEESRLLEMTGLLRHKAAEETRLRFLADCHGFRLVRSRGTREKPKPDNAIADDLIIGGENIAREIGVDLRKFYRMAENGLFADAVRKLGHRTYSASRRKLRIVLGLGDVDPPAAA
jgi:hypothetical protein